MALISLQKIPAFARPLNGLLLKMTASSFSTNQDVIFYRAKMFDEERQRQLNSVERIEKIEVRVNDPLFAKTTLVMNKHLSTPYQCAMHLNEMMVERSVLAQINDDKIYDMHRPLTESCEIKFLHFKQTDPHHVNSAYWRSCSFLLGYLLESSFKGNYFVDLCSFPPPKIQSGSFVYDAQLNIPDWKPTKDELRCLSISASKIAQRDLKFERLVIKSDLAREMFKYNKFKLQQIPAILESQKSDAELENRIVVYKLGDFVDISKGPMISSSALIGRFEVTGLFDIETEAYGKLQRLQGISIPKHLNLHYWTFSVLSERASKLNTALKPTLEAERPEETKQKQILTASA